MAPAFGAPQGSPIGSGATTVPAGEVANLRTPSGRGHLRPRTWPQPTTAGTTIGPPPGDTTPGIADSYTTFVTPQPGLSTNTTVSDLLRDGGAIFTDSPAASTPQNIPAAPPSTQAASPATTSPGTVRVEIPQSSPVVVVGTVRGQQVSAQTFCDPAVPGIPTTAVSWTEDGRTYGVQFKGGDAATALAIVESARPVTSVDDLR